jgi:hypothetical protein
MQHAARLYSNHLLICLLREVYKHKPSFFFCLVSCYIAYSYAAISRFEILYFVVMYLDIVPASLNLKCVNFSFSVHDKQQTCFYCVHRWIAQLWKALCKVGEPQSLHGCILELLSTTLQTSISLTMAQTPSPCGVWLPTRCHML